MSVTEFSTSLSGAISTRREPHEKATQGQSKVQAIAAKAIREVNPYISRFEENVQEEIRKYQKKLGELLDNFVKKLRGDDGVTTEESASTVSEVSNSSVERETQEKPGYFLTAQEAYYLITDERFLKAIESMESQIGKERLTSSFERTFGNLFIEDSFFTALTTVSNGKITIEFLKALSKDSKGGRGIKETFLSQLKEPTAPNYSKLSKMFESFVGSSTEQNRSSSDLKKRTLDKARQVCDEGFCRKHSRFKPTGKLILVPKTAVYGPYASRKKLGADTFGPVAPKTPKKPDDECTNLNKQKEPPVSYDLNDFDDGTSTSSESIQPRGLTRTKGGKSSLRY